MSQYYFFILYLLVLQAYFFNFKQSALIFFFVSVLFIIFAGFRSSEMPDTLNYINMYEGSYCRAFSCFAFYHLQDIHKYIFSNNYRSFFIFISSFNLLVVFYLLKKLHVRYSLVALSIYISYFGIIYNFIILRAGLAASLLLLSWYFIKKRAIISIMLFVLACLMHATAFIGIFGLFIVLYKKRIGSSIYLLATFFLLMFQSFNLDYLFIPVAQYFLESIPFLSSFSRDLIKYNPNAFHFHMYLLAFMFVYLIVFRPIDERYDKLLNLFFFGFILLYLFANFPHVDRLVSFYSIVIFALAPLTLDNSHNIFLKKTLLFVFINAFFVLSLSGVGLFSKFISALV
jgi:hypothetical protein